MAKTRRRRRRRAEEGAGRSGTFAAAKELAARFEFQRAEEILEALLEEDPGNQAAQNLVREVRRSADLSERGASQGLEEGGPSPLVVEVLSFPERDAVTEAPKLAEADLDGKREVTTPHPPQEEGPKTEVTEVEEGEASDDWLKCSLLMEECTGLTAHVRLMFRNRRSREIVLRQANIVFPSGRFPSEETTVPELVVKGGAEVPFFGLTVGPGTSRFSVVVVVDEGLEDYYLLEKVLLVTISNEPPFELRNYETEDPIA